MHAKDVAALKRLLVGKKVTNVTIDAEGMIIVEVGGRYALVPMADVEGNGWGALQWLDMKSDAQGVLA